MVEEWEDEVEVEEVIKKRGMEKKSTEEEREEICRHGGGNEGYVGKVSSGL